jgi:metal-responsive CopG/Arc/MetJ family transcriptional regulator
VKRVQLQLPDAVLDWIDAQADGIESRAAFIRRSLVGLMKADQRQEQFSRSGLSDPADQFRGPGRLRER